MSLVLPTDVYSQDQLSQLVLELRDLASHVRGATARGNKRETAPNTSVLLAQLLEANHVASDDIAAIEALATESQKALDTAPTAHIMLTAVPGTSIKRMLTEWFRTNCSPLILLTFAARSDLGGGIVVHAGSHLYDMSFRRRIIDNKSRLTELARV